MTFCINREERGRTRIKNHLSVTVCKWTSEKKRLKRFFHSDASISNIGNQFFLSNKLIDSTSFSCVLIPSPTMLRYLPALLSPILLKMDHIVSPLQSQQRYGRNCYGMHPCNHPIPPSIHTDVDIDPIAVLRNL